MTRSTPVSLRLDPDLLDRIAAIASALDRPRSWAIEQAVRDYVTVQEWQIGAIREGIEDAEAGRVVDHSEVADWVASWGTDSPKPMPKCD
jgi:predicted transcriptional regulator